ncbi:hypothetical protein [Azospirillum lipoferum]|uniref:hypothetical protein n=1 Tax=Azospirillum lipoferum TaxID=193 RepID=UPI001395DE63|nr:hypothetical protein [Azospirillum lipoferum]
MTPLFKGLFPPGALLLVPACGIRRIREGPVGLFRPGLGGSIGVSQQRAQPITPDFQFIGQIARPTAGHQCWFECGENGGLVGGVVEQGRREGNRTIVFPDFIESDALERPKVRRKPRNALSRITVRPRQKRLFGNSEQRIAKSPVGETVRVSRRVVPFVPDEHVEEGARL